MVDVATLLDEELETVALAIDTGVVLWVVPRKVFLVEQRWLQVVLLAVRHLPIVHVDPLRVALDHLDVRVVIHLQLLFGKRQHVVVVLAENEDVVVLSVLLVLPVLLLDRNEYLLHRR